MRSQTVGITERSTTLRARSMDYRNGDSSDLFDRYFMQSMGKKRHAIVQKNPSLMTKLTYFLKMGKNDASDVAEQVQPQLLSVC